MTPQETQTFAACRMHVAHLHNALNDARDDLASALEDGLATGERLADLPAMRRIAAALAESEPAVKDLLADADRDAKLVACRAELQSKADALAQVTARLSKIEAAARACPHCEGCEGATGECGIDSLAEALK